MGRRRLGGAFSRGKKPNRRRLDAIALPARRRRSIENAAQAPTRDAGPYFFFFAALSSRFFAAHPSTTR